MEDQAKLAQIVDNRIALAKTTGKKPKFPGSIPTGDLQIQQGALIIGRSRALPPFVSDIGDKIGLWNSNQQAATHYAVGVQSGRMVLAVPTGGAVSIRTSQDTSTGVHATSGSDKLTLWENGVLDVTGNVNTALSSGGATASIGNYPTFGNTYAAFWRTGNSGAGGYTLLSDTTITLLNAPTDTGFIFLRGANNERVLITKRGIADPAGFGTTLPTAADFYTGAIPDGQRFTLTDSVASPSYRWEMRYNAGSSSAYKWEYIGGTPKILQSFGTIGTITTAGVAFVFQTGFTVPNTGEYTINASVTAHPLDGTTQGVTLWIYVAGVQSWRADDNTTGGFDANLAVTDMNSGAITAGGVISQGQQASTVNMQFQYALTSIAPRRLQ